MVEDATSSLLAALAHSPHPSRPPSPDQAVFDWGLQEAESEQPSRPLTFEHEVTRTVAQALLERFESDEEEEEREDECVDEEAQVPEPLGTVDDGIDGAPPNLRKRALPQDDTRVRRHWFPWYDKITCTLDVLTHLPRSVFSQRQLDLFLWLLRINDVEDVPSVRHMLRLNAALQRACGIDSVAYKGVLGHTYYVNALNQIIAQMANPRVRPHLSFYPENTDGKHLSEARQAVHWLDEVPDEFLTPMIRIGAKDYYVHEPFMDTDGRVRMPMWWFTRVKSGVHVLYAKCWEMVPVSSDVGAGWRVIETPGLEVPADRLLKNFPDLCTAAPLYQLPPPTIIFGIYTDPKVGNPWRVQAKGHRVVAFPLWMYCDDTSGNLSKKWNEHNSVLVTAAGLPREQAQKEYNIHFLTTSNIAPPLEMMDGVVEQLLSAQKTGIWAWDCVWNEPILVLPSVLALLGDNPMQSEFACHIGLQAKLFCRNCWVKGRDVFGEQDGERERGGDAASVASDDSGGTAVSLCRLCQPGTARNKHETAEKLQSYFTLASIPGTKTKIKERRTESGIKDTLQLAHLETLFKSYKNKRGYTAKQAALSEAIAQLPDTRTNPIWHIRGLDAHQDTPVEVLHVVLLGFVKYFWRDLVQGQLKNKADLRELLATRLSSLDVAGLGISPLAGRTLVQYAGSLTGRDFRAIAQVAPFVIYDMVSPECYEAWVALSRLVPLIWQPHINNVADHLALLKKEIDYFLLTTARWSVRWFNKPKFHIILHLVEHVRRFGPAGLFATEAFESFNAVIRAKSVHSNRQAPSRDIARAFAQSNRIRHLLSGGFFMYDSSSTASSSMDGLSPSAAPATRTPFSFDRTRWRTVGAGPLSLVRGNSTVTDYLALSAFKLTYPTGKHIPSLLGLHGSRRFRTGEQMTLLNGDKCIPGSIVVVNAPGQPGGSIIGRVDEILTPLGSILELNHQADRVLLQPAVVTRPAASYGMPYIDLQDDRDLQCTVNVQHDCRGHKCSASGSIAVRQERELTTQVKASVVHNQPKEGILLNVAQMRDSRHILAYRPVAPMLNTSNVVLSAVAREVDAQKTRRVQGDSMPSETRTGAASSNMLGQHAGSTASRDGWQGQRGSNGRREGGARGGRGGAARGGQVSRDGRSSSFAATSSHLSGAT
ncbi:hypothetical protein C8Q77DRAFT_1045284 [Trametes polyzona]|nr:hypothetical protein C8Q77DRAFT_1045284 [Trametes polyzona]